MRATAGAANCTPYPQPLPTRGELTECAALSGIKYNKRTLVLTKDARLRRPDLMMIDVFNHFMPKAYLDRLGSLIPGHVALTAFPRLKTLWDADARLALLDEFAGLQ